MRRLLATLGILVMVLGMSATAGAEAGATDVPRPSTSASPTPSSPPAAGPVSDGAPDDDSGCETCFPLAVGVSSAVLLAVLMWRLNRPGVETDARF